MKKKENKILESRLLQIKNTLFELEFIKKDIISFTELEEKEREKILNKSIFFKRLYFNYRKLFIIELFKLIGKREDHNIQKLLVFCITERKRIEWKNEITLKELNSLTDKINIVSKDFEKIEGLRNRHYAHNDKNKQSYSYSISFLEICNILKELQDIFSKLSLKFEDTHWDFDFQYNTPKLIPDLYKYQEIKKLTFHNENTKIERSDLIKIITKQ